MPKRGSRLRLPPISENEPRVQKPRYDSLTKIEHPKDHAPPCPKYCACHEICTGHEKSTLDHHNTKSDHEKSTLEHQNARFPVRLPRKVITKSENVHGTTTRAQSRAAPAPAPQILRAEVHFEDLEVNECTVAAN